MKNALLVPVVFFLSFLCSLLTLSFFSGVSLRYELMLSESESAGLLFLCIVQRACYILPIVTVIAIIAVYIFLMRHRAKLIMAASLILICLVFTVTVIMPFCYAQLASIEALLKPFRMNSVSDAAITAFLDKPLFLIMVMKEAETIFRDLYDAYLFNFTAYVLFSCAFFLCITSFWVACIATRWKMINLFLLFIFTGIFLFLYQYVHHDFVQSLSENLHLNSANHTFRVSLILCIIALILHSAGALKTLLSLPKRKRRTA